MHTTGVVAVVVVVGSFGCFSTARYDDAHLQRVAIINARYAAEVQRVDQQYASYIAALDNVRMELIPMTPGADVPVSRIVEREDLVLCRRQCEQGAPAGLFERQNEPAKAECFREVCRPATLDALRRTYFRADVSWVMSQPPGASDADLEAMMARSHNREVRRTLDEQKRALAQQSAQVQRRLARECQVEVRASEQQRTSEIASSRAVRRARLEAADAFTAMGQRSINARQRRQRCVGAIDDQLLSRVGDCATGASLPGGAASLQNSQPPEAGQPAARQ